MVSIASSMTEAPGPARDLPAWSRQRAGRRPVPGTPWRPGPLIW